jgi:hypothetical protein
MSSLGQKFFGTASQPFFLTAGMVQPPLMDPMAIWDMQNLLVGMGLKAGEVTEPGAEAGSLAHSLAEAGQNIAESMPTFEGLTHAASQVSKSIGEKLGNISEDMDHHVLGRATKSIGHNVGEAGSTIGSGISSMSEKIGLDGAATKMKELTTTGGKTGVELKEFEHAAKASEKSGNNITKLTEEHQSGLNILDENTTSISDIDSKLADTTDQHSPEQIAAFKNKKNNLEKQNENIHSQQKETLDNIDKEHAKLNNAHTKLSELTPEKMEELKRGIPDHKGSPINNKYLTGRLDNLEEMKQFHDDTHVGLSEETRVKLEEKPAHTSEEAATLKQSDATHAATTKNTLDEHDKAITRAEADHGKDSPEHRQAIKNKEVEIKKINRENIAHTTRETQNKLQDKNREQINAEEKQLHEKNETHGNDSSYELAAKQQLVKALALYQHDGVSNKDKIDALNDAIDFASSSTQHTGLVHRADKALNELNNLSRPTQRGGGKSSIDVDDILEKVLVKTNKEIEEHIKQHDKVEHPNFPDYALVLTSEELDKTGMFYTHCYEEDKLCKDEVKKHFEDVLKSFEHKEKRQQEEKVRPKHLFHEKKFAQLHMIFETLSTKQEQIEMHDIMIELFMALKEDKSKKHIINLLNKGIRKGNLMGVKLIHTYQALHNIDIKERLKPSDELDYLNTMMGIIFCPMCPFIELANMLDMKQDINDEYYTLMHNNKTLILTIVHNYYSPGNNGSSTKEKQTDIARETVRRYKELMRIFEKDPITKQIHDGVIDSLYDEFKLTNSKECDPWKFLTQDINIDIDVLLTHCKKAHKIGLLPKKQKDIAVAFKHAIDIFDDVMSHSKEDNGIWPNFLHSIKDVIEMEKKQQKVIFMKVIDGYTSNTLTKSLKATTKEEKGAIQLEKHTLHFLEQLTNLLNFDNISGSLEYDYSVYILKRLVAYMGIHINSIFEKLLKLGTIEGKHDEGVYHSKLTTTKDYINGYILDMFTLSENITFRFSLYKKLHPVRENEDELRKLAGVTHTQKGGSSNIENQLKQQLEDAKTRLHELDNDENKLRQMRGGLRKSRQFTRKQRGGGKLSSSLKQYDTNTKSKEGGKLNKNTVDHFGKIQQLESELNTNKFETYKQLENTYKQLVHLKHNEVKLASNSCLHKQLMHKVNDLDCGKACLRHLQTEPTNNKIKCGCKSMPSPFKYKNC